MEKYIYCCSIYTLQIYYGRQKYEKKQNFERSLCFANYSSDDEITNRGDLLWDNGMTNDPDGAWSNFDAQYGGANRSLMDDVVIPPGEEWKINELQFYSVWYGEEPGHGTDFVLNFWSDNSSGPGPGTPLETVETISYGEEKTGGVMF